DARLFALRDGLRDLAVAAPVGRGAGSRRRLLGLVVRLVVDGDAVARAGGDAGPRDERRGARHHRAAAGRAPDRWDAGPRVWHPQRDPVDGGRSRDFRGLVGVGARAGDRPDGAGLAGSARLSGVALGGADGLVAPGAGGRAGDAAGERGAARYREIAVGGGRNAARGDMTHLFALALLMAAGPSAAQTEKPAEENPWSLDLTI